MRDPAIFKIAIKLFRQGTPNRFFSYKVWKFEEVSHDVLVLRFPHGCLLGKLQYLSFVKVSEEVIVLFCVAGVVFRSIPTCFITCRKSFCVTSAILLRRFQKMTSMMTSISWQVQRFGDLHRHFAWHAQHFRRVLLRILQIAWSGLRQVVATCKSRGRRRTSWECMSFCVAGAVFRADLLRVWTVILRGKRNIWDTLHSTLYNLHFALCTLRFKLYTSHFTLDTSHTALYTLHSGPFTLNFTLRTLHSTPHTVHL